MTEATPMSWADLNLNEVITERSAEASSERTELPAGNYKFRFVAAKPNPYESGTTDLDFVVAEGPNSKRHLFAKIPSPNTTKYAIQWAAVLIKTLGISQQPGEDLIDTLNRGAASGTSAFTADVIEDTFYSTKQAKNVTKPKLQFFSLQPSV